MTHQYPLQGQIRVLIEAAVQFCVSRLIKQNISSNDVKRAFTAAIDSE